MQKDFSDFSENITPPFIKNMSIPSACEHFTGIHFEESTPSTMLMAKEYAPDRNYDGSLFLALSQTEGSGTNGRKFLSEEGGIYLSALFNSPSFDPSELTVRIPVGLCFAIHSLCGEKAGIKWVNDIILNGKKTAGILVRTAYMGNEHAYTIIGVGMNINQPSFGEFSDVAGSLFTLTGKNYDLPHAASVLIKSLHEAVFEIPIEDIMDVYRENSVVIGKGAVVKRGEEILCTVKDISPKGHLIAECSGEIFEIISRSEVVKFL